MSVFKSETTLPILVTVMCVLIITVTILYGYNIGKFPWLENRYKKQIVVQKEEEKTKRTDYTEVARKILDRIDKEKNEKKGIKLRGLGCLENGCEMKNKDDLIAIWVRLYFYNQHQDPKDLEIVKKDIDNFYDEYKDDDLSDSLWICKITYEMAQSKFIDQTQKDKLEKLCFNTKQMTVDEKEKYVRENFEKGRKKFVSLITLENNFIYQRYVDNYFGQITDLAYKYAWSGDNKYKELIEKYFIIEEKLIINNNVREPGDLCLFGLSILDEWRFVTKNKTKLDYVTNLYKTIQTKSEVDDFWTNPICGLFVKGLFDTTKEIAFFEKLESINKEIIVNNELFEMGKTQDTAVESSTSKRRFGDTIEDALIVNCLL